MSGALSVCAHINRICTSWERQGAGTHARGSFVLRQNMHSFPYCRKRSRKVHQVDRGLGLELNVDKIEPMPYPEKDEGNRK